LPAPGRREIAAALQKLAQAVPSESVVPPTIDRAPGDEGAARRKPERVTRMRMLIVLVLIVGALAAAAAGYVKWVAVEPPASFRTTKVSRSNLLVTIGATGTVEPEFVVDMGAQIVGRIKGLGIDADRLRDELKRLGASPDKLAALSPDNFERSCWTWRRPSSLGGSRTAHAEIEKIGFTQDDLNKLKPNQLLPIGAGILQDLGVDKLKDLGSS